MNQTNEKVRQAARVANIPLYAIATAVGVSEATLHRWMRVPLPADKEQRIMLAIQALSREVH